MPATLACELLDGEQVPLFALAAGVADHAGRAADQGDRPVAGLLKAAEQHHRQQRADVQAVAGGVEAGVERPRLAGEPGAELLGVRGLVDEAAEGEVGEEVHGSRIQGSGVRDQVATDSRLWRDRECENQRGHESRQSRSTRVLSHGSIQ